jgi:hypothetical protein
MNLDQISDYIAVAAGLGTAAFALVDASKAFWGGVSNCGFGHIRRVVTRFLPGTGGGALLNLDGVIATLRANWLNGTALGDQKAIAKSLIKLRLNTDNASHLASAAGMPANSLNGAVQKITAGKALAPQESDTYGRFDLILTAVLDEGYQRADQSYRNSARVWSIVVAIGLAVTGVWLTQGTLDSPYLSKAILVGLVATPIAPIAKDLTSALSAGVKVAQMLRK